MSELILNPNIDNFIYNGSDNLELYYNGSKLWPHIYHVTTSGSHGTVTASPNQGKNGTTVTLSNTPDTHYHFGSYSLTGATLKNANQFDIANSDVTVVGNFVEDTKYSVTCTNDGHGTISASPTSNYSGSTVTLSNTPNTGYNFDKYTLVSGTGASISGNTLTIGTSNVTVRGDFVAAAPADEVTIGGITWKTKNLAIDDGQGGIYTQTVNYGQGNVVEYYYTWAAAVRVAASIPGWYLPTTNDWDSLATAVGGSSTAGTKLKSTTGWSSGAGEDSYGFAAYPAGRTQTSGASFVGFGKDANFWTSNEYSSTYAHCRAFNTGESMRTNRVSKNFAYSVRLIKA